MVDALVNVEVAVVFVGIDHVVLQAVGQIDGVAVERQQLVKRQRMAVGVKMARLAEKEGGGFMNPTVGSGPGLKNFFGTVNIWRKSDGDRNATRETQST